MAIIYAATNNYLHDVEVTDIQEYEAGLFEYVTQRYAELMQRIADNYYDEGDQQQLKQAVEEYTERFLKKNY